MCNLMDNYVKSHDNEYCAATEPSSQQSVPKKKPLLAVSEKWGSCKQEMCNT